MEEAVDYVAAARKRKGDKAKAKAKAGAGAGAAADAVDEPARADPAARKAEPRAAAGAGSEAATATADAEAEFRPETMKTNLLFSFASVMSQFLDACAVVWAKDAQIAAWKATFDATAAGSTERERTAFFTKMIEGFHDLLKGHYAAVADQNPEVFADASNPWLAAVHAAAKYGGAHPQVRAQVWEYAAMLCRLSNMHALYGRVPPTLMSHIHRLAVTLGGQMQRGETTLAALNPIALGEQLIKVLNADELKSFATSLTADGGIEGVVSMLQGMVASLGGNVGGLADFAATVRG